MKVEVVVQQILSTYNSYAAKADEELGSDHEGFAMIQHSLDDLWDAIKRGERAVVVRAKAKEVVFEAMRFMVERT